MLSWLWGGNDEKADEEAKKEEERQKAIEDCQNKIKGDLENLMGTVVCHSPISLFDHDEAKLNMTKEQLNPTIMFENFKKKYIENFKYPTDTDEFRPLYANNEYGGFDFSSEKTLGILRGMGWDLIKQIGQKLISGDFNLTTVTIPIKVMVPISILQHICNGHFNFPLYLNLASQEKSSLEKLKFVVIATISCWYKSSVILKPLNPILGETYEMIWEDGSHEYVEQTVHHPPCSNYIIYGPNNNYKFSGYYDFKSNAWVNSCKLVNQGKRKVEFKDGTIIDFDYIQDEYSNTFWGTMRHENVGEIHWKVNDGLECTCKFGGNDKSELSDYFIGEIKDKEGKILSRISGSYLSHIDIDGKRVWDIRRNIDIEAYPVLPQLKSSSIYRPDEILLYEKKIEEAQEAKTSLENIQRKDRKLRKEYIEKKNENQG